MSEFNNAEVVKISNGMKQIACIIFIFILLTASDMTGALRADNAADTIVRVMIIDDRQTVYLSLKGRYKIYEINSDRVVLEGPYLSTDITGTKTGLRIGRKETNIYGVKVRVQRDSNIYVDGRRFRGDVDIIRRDNQKLMVINYIGLDDYLYGVLYHEVSHRWPLECLKAQAIAARTFALYQAKQNSPQPYDLRSDIYSQVYGGRTSEKWSTTRAVNLTKGRVLACKGDLLPAYYHATCGGHTEDAMNLWNTDLPPLKGVACDFCKNSPHYRWTKEVSMWELENDLKGGGYKIGKISAVNLLSKNISGRVDKLEIKDDSGVAVVLTGKDFRQLIGPNNLRSTKFDVSIKRNNLIVNGFGWGHGVGMCQWGAYEMARKGKKCEEILQYYYPGAEITTIDKVKK